MPKEMCLLGSRRWEGFEPLPHRRGHAQGRAGIRAHVAGCAIVISSGSQLFNMELWVQKESWVSLPAGSTTLANISRVLANPAGSNQCQLLLVKEQGGPCNLPTPGS